MKNNRHNCKLILEHDPLLKGVFRYNILTEQTDLVKPVWWERISPAFTDMDLNYIMLYLEETYGLTMDKVVQKSIVHQADRNKYHPVRNYLNTVTVYGKILDKNYTQLLYSNEDLDMRTVFLLDKVQKQEVVSKESFKDLKKKGLVEGRYPNVFVSFKVADIVGQKAAYVRNKGLDDDICKQLIIKALQSMGEASKRDLMEVLEKALPEVLSDEQKSKKVSNLLQAMKKDGIVVTTGTNRYAKWYLIKK